MQFEKRMSHRLHPPNSNQSPKQSTIVAVTVRRIPQRLGRGGLPHEVEVKLPHFPKFLTLHDTCDHSLVYKAQMHDGWNIIVNHGR